MDIIKKIKIGIVVFSSCLLCLVVLGGLYYEQNSCMGISMISANRLESYIEDLSINVSYCIV